MGVVYTQFEFTVVDHNSTVSATRGGGVSTHQAFQRAFNGGRAAYCWEVLLSSPTFPYDKNTSGSLILGVLTQALPSL